jgi:anti-sigma regulatory factor (Ser/Thr protein kinase)
MTIQYKKLEILAIVENLRPVLDFISTPLREKGCPESVVLQIEVVAEEVFINIAHYAYPPVHGDATILVSVDDVFEVVFSDAGKPFDPLQAKDPDVTLSVEERVIGGLGIYMTKKIMDEVSYRYEEGRNILTLRKKL